MVEELHCRRGAVLIVHSKFLRSRLPKLQLGYSQHFPNVDDHVRVAHQEQMQVRIARHHTYGHAAIEGNVVQDRGHFGPAHRVQLVDRDRADGLARAVPLLVPCAESTHQVPCSGRPVSNPNPRTRQTARGVYARCRWAAVPPCAVGRRCSCAISPPLDKRRPSLRRTPNPVALPIIRLAQAVSLSQTFPNATVIDCEETAQNWENLVDYSTATLTL